MYLITATSRSDCRHFTACRFQIVALPDGQDSDLNNGSWRIGDWADTLELPNIGFQAIVRWIPGPLEITGELQCSSRSHHWRSTGMVPFVRECRLPTRLPNRPPPPPPPHPGERRSACDLSAMNAADSCPCNILGVPVACPCNMLGASIASAMAYSSLNIKVLNITSGS